MLGSQNARQQLDGSLAAAFGPTVGLLFEADDLGWKFRRRGVLRQINKLPALQLRAIRKIQIFGQRIVLPAAGIIDGRATPHPGGSVEMHKPAAAITGGVLDHEVTIQKNRLALGEQRCIAI